MSAERTKLFGELEAPKFEGGPAGTGTPDGMPCRWPKATALTPLFPAPSSV
jgi:hypothetical protein